MKLNLYEVLIMIYKYGGKEAVKRFITPPEEFLARVKNKKVPLAVVLEERDEAIEETMELFESIIDENFVDPD